MEPQGLEPWTDRL